MDIKTLETLLDSDLLWLLMRARGATIAGKSTLKDRDIERNASHVMQQRYNPESIMGALVRECRYTDAYLHWSDAREY